MEQKGIEQIKKLIAGFTLLATKLQKDNQIKSKNLKATNQVLDACKKEYQKLYHENETHKKKFAEQQKELLKCQNQLKNQTMSSVKEQGRKTKLNNTEFNENKLKNLFAARKMKRRYCDYYSDNNDNESADDECEDSDVEESDEDEEVILKKKKYKKKQT